MTELRPGLPQVPSRMSTLPLDKRGFPVPWFVAWVEGEPKFQIADSEKFVRAVKFRRCWLCGEPLGSRGVFVIGPMCGINRVSADPPSHQDCAEFAAKACPFLSQPLATRSTRGIEEIETKKPAGEMIARNPGVTLLWTSKKWSTFGAPGGYLFNIGEPEEILFYREGRAANRDEIDASVESGLPALRDMALAEGNGAVAALERMQARFGKLLEIWA